MLWTIIDFFSSKHEKQLKIGRSNIQIDLGVENYHFLVIMIL